MNKVALVILISFFSGAFWSCNSNALTQANAEKTNRAFLATQAIQTQGFSLSPATVKSIGKTNIYAQFHTSVKVEFETDAKQNFRLLFDFTRTPRNKWFLESVEVVDDPPEQLAEWLKTKKNLHIAAQWRARPWPYSKTNTKSVFKRLSS